MSAGVSLVLGAGSAARRVRLDDALGPAGEEAARNRERVWIKAVRQAHVDGVPFRQRFTYREDSLWWFAEIYLHKQQRVLRIMRALEALERLAAADAPRRIGIESGDSLEAGVVAAFCAARGLECPQAPLPALDRPGLTGMDARSAWLHGAAMLSRLRTRPARPPARPVTAAAFVHQAFVAAGQDAAGGESYIGPVLQAIAAHLAPGGLHAVGVGPSANFRARRWWHPVAGIGHATATPIESYAPYARLASSRAAWRGRHVWRRALCASPDLRAHAVIAGCDCWPIVALELAGIALLQWTWSARAMDEAGAALDAIGPQVAVTYAEAGGWGRAIVLEARRRGIPTAGLQHGFIYRHWLNYRHEEDEMRPEAHHPADAGFPRPTATLVFDGFAADHLVTAGAFPPASVEVTGSPRLDDLVRSVEGMSPTDRAAARAAAGADPQDRLLVMVTKHRESAGVLGACLDAAGMMPGVHVAIKAHPAETAEAYADLVRGRAHVSVLPPREPLAPLLAAARALVTVNSTVALDAAVLGIPSLVIGLPNNLSPFVETGVLAGSRPGQLADDLRQILYDERFRDTLAETRRAVLARYRMGSDGQAAERAAAAVLRLAGRA